LFAEGSYTLNFLNECQRTDLSRVLVIKELTPEYANDLINTGFAFGIGELYPPLSFSFLQAAGLIPRVTRLVAFHTEEKRAIGFLCLIEENDSVFSIKFVFVNPKFRRLGIASLLFNFALNLAKHRGARQVYLDVEDWNSNAAKLYEQLGFQNIGTKMAGQGFLTNNARLRVVKHTLKGQGYFTNFSHKETGQLIRLKLDSEKNKKLLFNIYQSCMRKRFLTFFKLNPENIINGYSQMWRRFCFRDVFVNSPANSYALIFNRPLFSNASLEVNSLSQANIPFILDDLVKILDEKGIAYAHITLFNVCDPACQRWFKDKGFKLFRFFTMGITLDQSISGTE
jgi:ribosomal protein S18 acetylase RimI-like enzyme